MADDEDPVLSDLREAMGQNLRLRTVGQQDDDSSQLKIKCMYRGELYPLHPLPIPVSFNSLIDLIRKRFQITHPKIYFLNSNTIVLFQIETQSQLDKALEIMKKHDNMRSLSLYLTEDRSSPEPGMLPEEETDFRDDSSSVLSVCNSEGEFIPEPDYEDSPHLPGSSRQSQSSLHRLRGSRTSIISDSAIGFSSPESPDPPSRTGGTYPRLQSQNRRPATNFFSYPSRHRPPVLDNNSPPPTNWVQGKLLGQGAFGKVFECKDSDSGRLFAMKEVRIDTQHSSSNKAIKALEGEIHLLKSIRHENIIQYYGFYSDNSRLCIFMELMPGGSIRDELRTYGAVREILARKYTKQVLEGLMFLHGINIVHRDIKGANLLKDANGQIKLSDFGAAKIIHNLATVSGSCCGTAHYMSPEIIRGRKFETKADIWSLGATVVEFLTKNPPYSDMETVAVIYKVMQEEDVDFTLPEACSQEVRNFIRRCFTYNFKTRPSAKDLSAEPWFSIHLT